MVLTQDTTTRLARAVDTLSDASARATAAGNAAFAALYAEKAREATARLAWLRALHQAALRRRRTKLEALHGRIS